MRRTPFWLLAGVLAVAAPVLLSAYSLRVLDLAVISAIAVVGLCFAFGYAGLIHLAQAAFVGIGAYATAAPGSASGRRCRRRSRWARL